MRAYIYTPSIVAVTGLAGHAFGSWRGKGDFNRMWLQDFLSEDLPNCRTMIYGHNSALLNNGLYQIKDYTLGFISELMRVRSSILSKVSKHLSLPAFSYPVFRGLSFFHQTSEIFDNYYLLSIPSVPLRSPKALKCYLYCRCLSCL